MLWATIVEEGEVNCCPLMVSMIECPLDPVAVFPKVLLDDVKRRLALMLLARPPEVVVNREPLIELKMSVLEPFVAYPKVDDPEKAEG